MPPVTVSPRWIGPTFSGVPVIVRSPGRSSMEREAIEIMSDTGQRFCELSRRRRGRTQPEAVSLPCRQNGERGCRTTELKHAAAVGGNMLVVTYTGAEVVAEFVMGLAEAVS